MINTTLIEIPQWGTVTLIELVWLLGGLLAVFTSVIHLPVLVGDWKIAKQTNRETLVVVSWSYVRREAVRFFQGIIIVAIGTYAAIQAPLIPGPAIISFAALVLTAGLILLSLSISFMSWLDFKTRKDVEALIDQGKNGLYIYKEPQ